MKTSEITKFFKKNQKQVLIALGVIVAVIVVWIVVKRIRNSEKSKKDKIKDLTGENVTPGLSFDDFAQRIFSAWIQTFGTDEEAVYSVLRQLKTQADWEYLKVKYEDLWDGMPWYEQGIHSVFGLGLNGILLSDFRRELNNNELQNCRDILKKNGINPDF